MKVTAKLIPVGLAALALAAVGCGSGRPGLTLDQQSQIANIDVAIAETVLNGSHYRQTLDGVPTLIRLCRINPNAAYLDNETIKQDLEDDANTLRPYQPDLASDLDQAIANNCS